ncbi:MAG: hypothetical protein B6245_20835 [Desulfobacteraceae bacterium 4572_88]|nr:MAG: hypothetical protein B6245_20835 [Desulfobacteraceae bacterium 4572_88]
MLASEQQSRKFQSASVGTAEAFYMIFRTLSKKDRMAVAHYILEDDDIRHHCELDNAESF